MTRANAGGGQGAKPPCQGGEAAAPGRRPCRRSRRQVASGVAGGLLPGLGNAGKGKQGGLCRLALETAVLGLQPA